MKTTFKPVLFVLLMCGVFGADEYIVKAVREGDSVTLNPDLTQIQGFIELEWQFKDQPIAYTDGRKPTYREAEIFRDRLELNQTGSLTITNMKTKHSGPYHLRIDLNTGPLNVYFTVTVYESPLVIDAVKGEMKFESVKKGALVSLQTDVTQLYGDELIVWRFEDEGRLIAKSDMEAKSSPLYDDGRFRGRLELDQTGSLTITNTRTTDSGLYKLQISSKKQTSYKRFTVTVSEPDLSSGAVAGIVIPVLAAVVAAVAAAVAVVIYYRRKISELQKQTLTVPVSVTEGEDITLKLNNKINKDDWIQWMFGEGDQLTPIAEIKPQTGKIVTHEFAADGIFRGRLELDETTGYLIIKNSRTAHSGPYTLKITSRSGTSVQIFFVTVNEKVEEKPVGYGDSVILNTDTEIQRDEQILWMFGLQDDLIAQVKAGTAGEPYDDGAGEIFRGRLELNKTTGSLTIRNITPRHTGLYKLQIISRSRGTLIKKFRVSMPSRSVTTTRGEPVHLSTGCPKIERDDEIEWRFGAENSLIAKLKGGTVEPYDGPDGRFRDGLELNKMTGDLTILNSTAKHAGYYNLMIRSSKGDTIMTYRVLIRETSESWNASSGKRVNESAVNDPLLEAVVSDGVNEQEGMSSL